MYVMSPAHRTLGLSAPNCWPRLLAKKVLGHWQVVLGVGRNIKPLFHLGANAVFLHDAGDTMAATAHASRLKSFRMRGLP
jgi:hypothetical protein